MKWLLTDQKNLEIVLLNYLQDLFISDIEKNKSHYFITKPALFIKKIL